MIINIGFGADATHTKTGHPLASTRSFDVRFPLSHPSFVIPDAMHDHLYRRRLVSASTTEKALGYLRRVIRKLVPANKGQHN
jgi:hypothetical protein